MAGPSTPSRGEYASPSFSAYQDQEDDPQSQSQYRPPSFHSTHDPVPRYDPPRPYYDNDDSDSDVFSSINVDGDAPTINFIPAPADMPSYSFSEDHGDSEEVIRVGTPGYHLGEDGKPINYEGKTDWEDEKNDVSFDGEDWVAQKEANEKSERAGERGEEDPEKSPAISFIGGFGEPPAVSSRDSCGLSAMGVYQEGMAKNKIDDKEVQAHLYEYTTQLSVDPKLKFKGLEKGIMPTSNMYLAEDRILCWELVAKAGESWVLKYVKSAQGETDVPDTVAEFIGQRRRWLNGSFFASTYALTHFMQIHGTNHSFGKKMALTLQAIYNFLQLLFSWFGFFMILTSSLEDSSFNIKGIKIVNTFVQYAYQGTVIACFIFSMGNKPKASRWKYIVAISIFSLTTAYMLAAAVFCVVHAVKNMKDSIIFTEIVISLVSTYGSYIAASLIVTSMLQYLLLTSTYINLLQSETSTSYILNFAYPFLIQSMLSRICLSPSHLWIYSRSLPLLHRHDFSWGTKEQTTHEVDLGIAASAGSGTVDIALPSAQADIDVTYNDALDRIKTRPMIIPRPKNTKEKEEEKRDYYAGIRTNVLLAWVLSNAVLVATILDDSTSSTFTTGGGTTRTQVYLVIILIFVALSKPLPRDLGLDFNLAHLSPPTVSLMRFLGAVAYFVIGRKPKIFNFSQPSLPRRLDNISTSSSSSHSFYLISSHLLLLTSTLIRQPQSLLLSHPISTMFHFTATLFLALAATTFASPAVSHASKGALLDATVLAGVLSPAACGATAVVGLNMVVNAGQIATMCMCVSVIGTLPAGQTACGACPINSSPACTSTDSTDAKCSCVCDPAYVDNGSGVCVIQTASGRARARGRALTQL
ncbi:chitin synthase, partial [Phenoliferia sp. Uapishka_3]